MEDGGTRTRACEKFPKARPMNNSAPEAIRLVLQKKRRDLADFEQIRAAKAVAEPLQELVVANSDSGGANSGGTIASYIPHRGELDPSFGVHGLVAAGWRVVLPVCGDDGYMEFCPWSPGDRLVANRFGIGEPTTDAVPIESIHAVIVPGVAFDRKGNRLGHGVGFYDRFLARCAQQHHDSYRLGLAYDFQVVELPPPEPWDIPMQSVVSPTEVIDTTPCE